MVPSFLWAELENPVPPWVLGVVVAENMLVVSGLGLEESPCPPFQSRE
jgi:hypothetical protein